MINRDNYHAVKAYLRYQAEVLQRDPTTVCRHKIWLNHLLHWADTTAFTDAPSIRPVFPQYLLAGPCVSGRLTTPGVKRTCQGARAFFQWLNQARTASFPAITSSWIETLRPPRLPAEPHKDHEAVTLEIVRALLAVPCAPDDLRTRRDKAAMAFLFLSGMRATAFCTLTLQCVDVASRAVKQFPTMGVKTKNLKAAVTYLYGIRDLLEVVAEWDSFLREHMPPNTHWFPRIEAPFGMQRLSTDPPGKIRRKGLNDGLKILFEQAGFTPMTAHSFRHGHALFGLKRARDVGDLKAVSMNLMHESLSITDGVYAIFSDNDLGERLAKLSEDSGEDNERVEDALRTLQEEIKRLQQKNRSNGASSGP